MKKLILSALALSIIVVSCNKEEITPKTSTVDEKGEDVRVIKEEKTPIFLVDGNQKMEYSEIITKFETANFLYNYKGENIAFSSDEEFLAWCDKDISRKDMADKLRKGLKEQEWAKKNGIIDDEDATNKYTQKMLSENQNRGMSLILYDNINLGGSSVYSAPRQPTFFKFNNKAESMIMFLPGGYFGALCDKTWFRGDKFWYFALGGGSIPNLWAVNFGNKAESNL